MKIMWLVVYNVTWAEAYLPTMWHCDPSIRSATIDMGWKEGGGCCAHFGGGDAGSPSNTMWPGLRSTSVLSGISSSRLATTHMVQKLGAAVPRFWAEELGPRLTQCLTNTSLPSGTLIHLAYGLLSLIPKIVMKFQWSPNSGPDTCGVGKICDFQQIICCVLKMVRHTCIISISGE